MNTRARQMKKSRGQSILEVIVGSTILLIPTFLFGLDLFAVYISATVNRRLAYQSARAASYQDDTVHARQAAQQMIDRSPKSPIIQNITIDNCEYSSDQVYLKMHMSVKVPVPFPYFSQVDLVADSNVFITSKPADL